MGICARNHVLIWNTTLAAVWIEWVRKEQDFRQKDQLGISAVVQSRDNGSLFWCGGKRSDSGGKRHVFNRYEEMKLE